MHFAKFTFAKPVIAKRSKAAGSSANKDDPGLGYCRKGTASD
jgi:hypothetical protein